MANDHGLALFIHDSKQTNRAGGLRANVREPRGRDAQPLCTFTARRHTSRGIPAGRGKHLDPRKTKLSRQSQANQCRAARLAARLAICSRVSCQPSWSMVFFSSIRLGPCLRWSRLQKKKTPLDAMKLINQLRMF